MGLHRSRVLAVAALLAAAPAGVAANKKGLFGRMAAETTNTNAAADAAANVITAAMGAAADSLSTGGVLDKAMEHFSETQWKMAERAFAGDMLGVLRDSMLTNKQHLDELTEAWSNPKVFNYLYDNTPFFKAIKPLRALKEGFEGQTGWTSEQVRADGRGWRNDAGNGFGEFSEWVRGRAAALAGLPPWAADGDGRVVYGAWVTRAAFVP